jgi:4'-phosphopantetheinyl transferase
MVASLPSRGSLGEGTASNGQAVGFGTSGYEIGQDELHVWRASLARTPSELTRLWGWLSVDERERARRFRFERDRSRYVAGRGLLRLLLSSYLDRAPEALEFDYGEFQKPRLRGDSALQFNLSHSGPLALFAFSPSEEVGIDVELDDGDFARERIAERFFSPAEVSDLRALPGAFQPRAFLTCWTRKEAFIKARGDGMSLPLDSFDVSLRPSSRAAVLRTAWSSSEPDRWWMHDLSDPDGGYIAAAAMRGGGRRVIRRRVAETINCDGTQTGGTR